MWPLEFAVALLFLLNVFDFSLASNSSCLNVVLHDSFGDGWGNVLFYYETPGAESTGYYAPNCTEKYVRTKVCGSKEGFYFLVVQSGDNERPPENTWEIRWTVEDEKSGKLYTGGYNTSLVFDYDKDNDDFRILFWSNLWSNSLNLTTCEASSSSVLEGSCQPSPGQPGAHKPSSQVAPRRVSKPTATPVSQKIIGGKKDYKTSRRADASPDYILTSSGSVIQIYNETDEVDRDGISPAILGSSHKTREAIKYRVQVGSKEELSSGASNETSDSLPSDLYLFPSESNDSASSVDLYSSLVESRRSKSDRLARSRQGKLLKGSNIASTNDPQDEDQSTTYEAANSTETDFSSKINVGGSVYAYDGNSTDGYQGDGIANEWSNMRSISRKNALIPRSKSKREVGSSNDDTSESVTGGNSDNSTEEITLTSENGGSSGVSISFDSSYNETSVEDGGSSGVKRSSIFRTEIVKRSREKSSKSNPVLIAVGGSSGGAGGGVGNYTVDDTLVEGKDYDDTDTPSAYIGYNSSDSTEISAPGRVQIIREDRSHISKDLPSPGGDSDTTLATYYNGTDSSDHSHSSPISDLSGVSAGNSSESEGVDLDEDHLGSGIKLIGISSKKRKTAKTDRHRPYIVNDVSGGGGGDGGENITTSSQSYESLLLLSDSLSSNYTYQEHSGSVEVDFLRPSRHKSTRAPSSKRSGGRVRSGAVSEEVEGGGGGGGGGEQSNSTYAVSTEIPSASVYNETSNGEPDEEVYSQRVNGNSGGLFKGQQRKRHSSDEDSNSTVSDPTSEPTDDPLLAFDGRSQRDSGGLLKGAFAKRTRRHANHHHTSSPTISGDVSSSSGYDRQNSTANEMYPTGFVTGVPSPNVTVVDIDEDANSYSQDATNASTITYSQPSSVKATTPATPLKKLGRNKHKHSKVETGTPSVLLKVEMVSGSGSGWFGSNYEGLGFYISDESKTNLLAYGTLANGSYSGYCEFCFDDGSYYFRVSTPEAHNTKASWSFCHTTGEYGEQLSFHIENGECIPDALLDVNMICDATYSTVVTVQGSLTLTGVASEVIDSGSVWVLTSAISESVTGWDSSAIYISKTVLSSHPFNLKNRALSSFTYDVQFEASFVTEMAYEIDGTSYFGVIGLVEELKEELSSVISGGNFADTVRTLAISTGVSALDDVQGVSLLDLAVEDITYLGTKEIMLYDTDRDGEVEEADVQTSQDSLSRTQELLASPEFISFICMVAVGLVSFVGVIVVSIRLRRNSSATHDVIDDSMHSEQFMSVHKAPLSATPVRAGRL